MIYHITKLQLIPMILNVLDNKMSLPVDHCQLKRERSFSSFTDDELSSIESEPWCAFEREFSSQKRQRSDDVDLSAIPDIDEMAEFLLSTPVIDYEEFENNQITFDSDSLEDDSCSITTSESLKTFCPKRAPRVDSTTDTLIKSLIFEYRVNTTISVLTFLDKIIDLTNKQALIFDVSERKWLFDLRSLFSDKERAWHAAQSVRGASTTTILCVEKAQKYRGAPSKDPRRNFKDFLNAQLPYGKKSNNYNVCRLIYCVSVLLFAASELPEADIEPFEMFTQRFSHWTDGLDDEQIMRLHRCYLHMQSAAVYIPLYTNKSLIHSCAELVTFSGLKCTPGGKNPKFVKAVFSMLCETYKISNWNGKDK